MRTKTPDTLDAIRYRVKYRDIDKAYVTVSTVNGKPVELFVGFGTEADHETFYMHSAWSLITRLTSLCLQSDDISLDDIIIQVSRASLDERDAAGVLLNVLKKYTVEVEG